MGTVIIYKVLIVPKLCESEAGDFKQHFRRDSAQFVSERELNIVPVSAYNFI